VLGAGGASVRVHGTVLGAGWGRCSAGARRVTGRAGRRAPGVALGVGSSARVAGWSWARAGLLGRRAGACAA
jgi:hypothetical protein